MPYLKIWIHCVWATKNRVPVLTPEIRQKLFAHIRENAAAKQIHLDLINGYVDHVHCLISLNQEQTISKIIQLIKGESSCWINKTKLCRRRFEWQDGYFALSVSESAVNHLREYIKNQEEHHNKKSFAHEHTEFLVRHGFSQSNGQSRHTFNLIT